MRIKIFRKISLLCVLIMIISAVSVNPIPAQAASKILPADVSAASSDCTLVGLRGSYVIQAKAALEKINKIRKEACDKKIRDPRNEKRKLSPSDYVPVKWSSELEYQARLRAAESTIYTDHTRPNAQNCFTVVPKTVDCSYEEVLAWSHSTDMLYGIDLWYTEKNDWVNNTGGVTGHYTAMINPANTYVGLGTFISDHGRFPNSTAGRFSRAKSLDSTVGKAVKNVIQTIEVHNVLLSSVKLKKLSAAKKFYVGKKAQLAAVRNINNINIDAYGYVLALGENNWSSSKKSVVTVKNGALTFKKSGKAKINLKLKSGKTLTYSVKVYPKIPPKTKFKKLSSGKGKVKLKWKKSKGASGYEIQYSANKSFYGKKTVKLGKKTSKTINGLYRYQKYYFRIRAYSKSKIGISRSKWSGKKSKTPK